MASVAKGASTARAQGPVCCSYKATEGETEGFRLAAGCWVLGSRQKRANVGVFVFGATFEEPPELLRVLTCEPGSCGKHGGNQTPSYPREFPSKPGGSWKK